MTKLRVMLLDESPGRTFTLVQAMEDAGYDVVARLENDDNLAEQVRQIAPDLIVLDMEKPGQQTMAHLKIISEEQPRPVVMFTEEDGETAINEAVAAGVSAYIVDGLSPNRIRPIVEVAMARFRQWNDLKSELDETKSKLSQRKLIDKAKGIIMDKRGISEDEAYQALRRMAMDRSTSMVDTARNIIDVAEMLT